MTKPNALWLAVMATNALVAPAIAQQSSKPVDQAKQPDSVEGEIVVTAQRREQRLLDVPVSVSVTTGDMLARTNITNLSSLAARLPAIRIATTPGSNVLNLRGIGSGQNAGFEQAVGTFVDGIYRGRSRSTAAALFDLERVEVLRGPQTTFFGNNVIAGALNIVTRKPDSRQAFNGTLLYAPSDGEYSVEGGATLPLTDQLSVRIAGRAFGRDGWANNMTNGRRVPRERDWVGRISAAWTPVEGVRSDARFDRGRFRDHGAPVTEGVNCPPDPAYGPARGTCLRYVNSGLPVDDRFDYRVNNFPTRNLYDFTEAALTNSIDIGSNTLTAISGYFHHDADVLSDAAPFPVGGVIPGTVSAVPVNSLEKVSQYSQELRFQTPEDRVVSVMVGAYYSREDLDVDTYTSAYNAAIGVRAAPTYNASTPVAALNTLDQRTDNYSAFASLTAKITDALKVDLGLRYSSVHKSVTRSYTYGTGGATVTPATFVPGPDVVQAPLIAALGTEGGDYADPTRTDSKLMPSIKLRYQIAPDVLGYASYTNGFKAGGYAASTRKFSFEPEYVDAYELGLKAALLDRRLSLTLALFRGDYSDLQESLNVVVGTSVVSVIANAAKARAQGVEFGATLRVSRNLSLSTDISYLDSKYRSYPNASCTVLAATLATPCSQDMSGKRRAFAPEFSGNVGATFTAPVSQRHELRVEPLMYFTSSYFQTPTADPLLSQPGFAKIDLRASFGPADRSWEIAAIGKNLTNKATASFRNQLPGSPGTVWLIPETPRQIAFQLSAKF